MPCRCQWKITAIHDKKDIYTISQDKHDISLGGSWSLEDNLSVPHDPIITAQEHTEWRIIPANNGIPSAYLYVVYSLSTYRMTFFYLTIIYI